MGARGAALSLRRLAEQSRIAPGVVRWLGEQTRIAPTALRDPRLTVVAVGLVSLVAAIVAARVSGVSGPWLWNPDMPKIDYPWAALFHEALLQGRLPLWNDRLGLGFPLYAEGQIGAFYPPNWLIYRLPPLVALDLTRVLHLSLAGLGTGLLALRLTGSRVGALVAAVTTVLGGGIVTKLEWTNLVVAYAWIPWVLLPLVRRPAPTRWGLVAAGATWGIQALAAFPNIWLLTGLTAAVVLVATSPQPATFGRVVGFGLLGTAVGSVQLIPTLLLTTLSVRSTGLSMDDLFNSAATPFDVLSFAFANAFVRTDELGWALLTSWYPDGVFALLEVGAYVGLPVLALAAVGGRVRRARPLVIVVAVMLAIPLIAAFRPPLWAELPILSSLRSPVRSYVFVDLALALLAAFGMSRIARDPLGIRRAAITVAVFVVAYVLFAAAAYRLPGTFEGLIRDFSARYNAVEAARARELAIQALTTPLPAAAEVALGIAVVALLALRRRGAALLAVAGVAALPLFAFSPPANPVRWENSFTSAGSAFVQAVKAQNPQRLLTVGPPGWYAGAPNQLAAVGIPDIEMFSSLNLRSGDQLVESLRQPDDEAAALRELVGIDLIATFDRPCPGTPVAQVPEDRAFICRLNSSTRPPLWIPDDAATVAAQQGGGPLGAVDATVDTARARAGARPAVVESRGPTEARLRVEAPEPGWLYIDRAWWPAWQNTVDGAAVQTYRALGGQLLRVSAGRHEISQTLVPWESLAGLAIGVLALTFAIAWARGIPARRDRPRIGAPA